jgi:hypothetical protein
MKNKNEAALFDKMIHHFVRSVADASEDKKAHHHELYELAKHELWKFQEEQNAKFD